MFGQFPFLFLVPQGIETFEKYIHYQTGLKLLIPNNT